MLHDFSVALAVRKMSFVSAVSSRAGAHTTKSAIATAKATAMRPVTAPALDLGGGVDRGSTGAGTMGVGTTTAGLGAMMG